MSLDVTILAKKVEGLKKAYQNGDFSGAFLAVLNTANGEMQQRIFQDNKDVEGNSFGVYIGRKETLSKKQRLRLLGKETSKTVSKRIKKNADFLLTPYERKRANLGRQITHKDLKLFGSLRRSIETQVLDEKSAILEFSVIKAAMIARGQENQISNIRNSNKATTKGDGARIFRLNQEEKDNVVEEGRKSIAKIIVRELL